VTGPLVLKLGGELLESPEQREHVASFAAAVTAAGRPLVIVHGGGRAIDVEMARRRLTPTKIDGLRVTDAATLEAVVAVLAGTTNTELVASLVGSGLRAVGLTGVDAGFGLAARSAAHVTSAGHTADLGYVGDPAAPDPALLLLLLSGGYLPVVASLGIDAGPRGPEARTPDILNVNADVMACRIAAVLPEASLVIAGGTAGVLDAGGRTITELDLAAMAGLIENGTATAGMIAKLTACRMALERGVSEARIVDGRRFGAARSLDALQGTVLVPVSAAVQSR